MALLKEIQFNGQTLSYWKVVGTDYNGADGRTTVTLVPYVDKAAREANINSFVNEASQRVIIEGSSLTPSDIYDKVIASGNSVFSDAQSI